MPANGCWNITLSVQAPSKFARSWTGSINTRYTLYAAFSDSQLWIVNSEFVAEKVSDSNKGVKVDVNQMRKPSKLTEAHKASNAYKCYWCSHIKLIVTQPRDKLQACKTGVWIDLQFE